MKRILLFSLLLLSSLTLAACNGETEEVLEANVIFFTGNNNVYTIPSLLGVSVGNIIEAPEDPERAGFFFTGWYKNVELTEPWDFETDVINSSIVLYANWEPAIFSVTYDLNGGDFTTLDYVTSFETGDFKVLPTATRTGYRFLGWYRYDWEDESSTRPGDSGLQSIPINQTEDLNLYAHWEVIRVRVSFRSNYPVSNEGPSNPSSRTIPYGSIIDFPILADTDNYTFFGWNSRADGTGTTYENGDLFLRSQLLTLYAVWEPK